MIKAFLLIFRPVTTWNNIAVANRSVLYIFLLHVLPLILLTSFAEGYALTHWGKSHGAGNKHVKIYTVPEAVTVEITISLVYVGLVFLLAAAARAYSSTFHRRSTFTQAFTAMGYGVLPFFCWRLLDMWNGLFPWIPWAIGMVLTIGVIYTGLPCLLRPDPPHAFGLYVMTSLTAVIVFGLWRLLTWQFFLGRLPEVEKIVTQIAGGVAGGPPPP
ncbi:MAG TPA: YIP1 family protein [Verrucomicrobiota bacterium]|nr:YIP1 family protein [Verrucomicrobiota bacterium]HNT13931.1 YIP1 family protein [Verrucomicrobiota bacterium]